ncbi:hypothetical protein CDAR_509391 [Caerostris darwini]|uniref:Uncharacterized protein n=1 Tax=Caerostris darwini TaxID=1538125 RepID=A0AAV4UV65_9ARAC|nr:hypothetical protein CDAR_509391 [Caerostris darwini]
MSKSLDWGRTLDKPQQSLFKNPYDWKFSIINHPPGMHRNIHDGGKMRWEMTFEDSVVPWQQGEASFVLSLTLIAAAVGEGCVSAVIVFALKRYMIPPRLDRLGIKFGLSGGGMDTLLF